MRPPHPTGITAEILLRAYAAGIFPMAEGRTDATIHWVDPRRRGILPLHGFHISRSLRRRLQQSNYTIRTNFDFTAVLKACADRPETWINAYDLDSLPDPASRRLCPFAGGLGRACIGWRGLRRGARGGLFWRKHVLAPDRCVKDRAGLSDASIARGRLRAVRHPVPDATSGDPWAAWKSAGLSITAACKMPCMGLRPLIHRVIRQVSARSGARV